MLLDYGELGFVESASENQADAPSFGAGSFGVARRKRERKEASREVEAALTSLRVLGKSVSWDSEIVAQV